MCWMFSVLCYYWLWFNFDILYFSTDGCIIKSLTYLLTFQMQTIGQNETVAQYILVAEGQRDLQNKHIGRRTNYYQPDRQEIYR